nr:immunoglobulin heavy chain junction region [Macaca mulatta]
CARGTYSGYSYGFNYGLDSW